MSQEISSRQRAAETRLDAPATTGFAFLDMMLQMQRASQHALSSFIPLATNGVLASNVQATNGQLDQRIESKVSSNAPRTSNSVEVIPVGEETFHVGTRRSLLARVQTDQIVSMLKKHWPTHHFEIHAMATTADNDLKTALYKFNEKSLWTAELEVLLQNKEIDFIVHSLKDMPTQLPNDCILGAVTERNDPRDALVVHPTLASSIRTLSDLPKGSVVGTSSLRRVAQLKRHFPHLAFKDVRGNIGTRLANAVAASMRHVPPAQVGPETFLVSVAAAYQLRQGGPPVPLPPWVPHWQQPVRMGG